MYTRSEKVGFVLANLILLVAGLMLFSLSAEAQQMPSSTSWQLTMPGHLSRDPYYWYTQYLTQQAKADTLAKSGSKAISGLEASLKTANDSITRQNQTIRDLSKSVGSQATLIRQERQRADTAESKVVELAGKQPKTKVGRFIRKVGSTSRNVLAGIGAATVAVITLKLVL